MPTIVETSKSVPCAGMVRCAVRTLPGFKYHNRRVRIAHRSRCRDIPRRFRVTRQNPMPTIAETSKSVPCAGMVRCAVRTLPGFKYPNRRVRIAHRSRCRDIPKRFRVTRQNPMPTIAETSKSVPCAGMVRCAVRTLPGFRLSASVNGARCAPYLAIVVLLCGGDKGNQSKDIEQAKVFSRHASIPKP